MSYTRGDKYCNGYILKNWHKETALCQPEWWRLSNVLFTFRSFNTVLMLLCTNWVTEGDHVIHSHRCLRVKCMGALGVWKAYMQWCECWGGVKHFQDPVWEACLKPFKYCLISIALTVDAMILSTITTVTTTVTTVTTTVATVTSAPHTITATASGASTIIHATNNTTSTLLKLLLQ